MTTNTHTHTFEAHVHHGLQHLHVPSTEAGAESFAEVLGDVGGDVDADLIGQRGRAHREPEARGEVVQLLGANSFL